MKNNYLIVGGTSGIGEALVNLLSQNHSVYVWSRNNYKYITQHKSVDITSNEITIDELPEVLDGVVYCPGSINLKPFLRLTTEDFLADYSINFLGAVNALQKTFPLLKKSKNASVVLFSSVAANQGMPFHASIASAKAAIEGLTKSLAAEWAPTIRVNCIAPSLTDTPLAERFLSSEEKKEAAAKRNPMQQIGNPADLAEAVAFLLSEKSKWITGQTIHIDGGLSTIKF